MKLNLLKYLFFSFFAVLVSSCLDSTSNTTSVSSDASFMALTFAANDSIPNIHKAVFTVEYDALMNESIIVNIDSLPYKTRIDSVNPKFTFYSTSGARLIFDKDSVNITGTDTIDFSQSVKLRNYASDGVANKLYRIKVNVHKVEPELYIWSKVKIDLGTSNIISQKAIILNDMILYYTNDGSGNKLYTSTVSKNDSIWESPTTITDLPTNATMSDMTLFKGSLYLTQNSDLIYSSSNGTSWTTKLLPNYNFKSLLFALNDKLWAITQSKSDNSKYYFASSADGIIWAVNTSDVISDKYPEFPMNDFSAISFSARTGKQKAIVIGGKNSYGKIKSWSTENGTYWVSLSNENNNLDTLATGSSIISYDNKLLLFGNSSNRVNHFRESIDEGLTWRKPDSAYNYLPKAYQMRSYQSVVVCKPIADDKSYEANRIFIIGGKNASTVFSDAWTGKLNRKYFLR